MSNESMFSCHCTIIILVSHLAGWSTRELTERVFTLHGRVGKWLALGPSVSQ